jgi:hypothetical protein
MRKGRGRGERVIVLVYYTTIADIVWYGKERERWQPLIMIC